MKQSYVSVALKCGRAFLLACIIIAPALANAAEFASPPDTGVLFDPAKPADIANFNRKSFTITAVDDGGIKAVQASTDAASGWPDFDLPAPSGGWNLSEFGGVKMEVKNAGQTEATVGLRADNEGSGAWNTELVKLAPGETKTLSVSFGVSYHQIGYELNTAKVVRLKVFLSTPKPPTVLVLKNVKAFPKSEAYHPKAMPPPDPNKISLPGLTKAADRDIPVTPAAWVGTKPPVDGNWVKTFDDNFDGTTLNDKLWTIKPWGNGVQNQLQFYSMKNVYVGGGLLHLKSEKRPGNFNEDPKMIAKDYASGYLDGWGKWTQTYGYFEARIKLPSARGLWPAFWMMPDRGEPMERHLRGTTKNNGMEFDIMEYLCEWGQGRYNIATHWDDYGVDHKHWGNSSTYFGPTPDGWHTYGLLWEPGKATWYCDGIKKAEQIDERIGSTPEYFILNTQMGGWATSNVDDAKLPDEMLVDYVRAWQLKDHITSK